MVSEGSDGRENNLREREVVHEPNKSCSNFTIEGNRKKGESFRGGSVPVVRVRSGKNGAATWIGKIGGGEI